MGASLLALAKSIYFSNDVSVRPYTLRGQGQKNLSRVEKGVPAINVTFRLPLCHWSFFFICARCRHCRRVVFRELKQRRRRRQRGRQKSNRFRFFGKTTTLDLHQAFLYISLPSLHDYNVKVFNFSFSRGREHKTTTFFFFS